MEREAVLDAIENIQERICCEIINMNAGGCGVFAAELLAALEELGYDDAQVRIFDYAENNMNISEVESLLRKYDLEGDLHNWYDNGVGFGHVKLQWHDRLIDSEGTADHDENATWGFMDKLQPGAVSSGTIKKLANNAAGWNYMYDRSQNRTVRRIIREELQLN